MSELEKVGASDRSAMVSRWLPWVAFAAIVVAAAVVNIYQLEEHPPGLFCDEAAMGYNSYSIAEAGMGEDGDRWPLLFWSFAGYKDPAYIYPGAIVVKLLGLTVFSTRLTSALFGVASVIVIFFLGRSLAGAWVGVWSALFLAFMPWHIHFSRIAFGVTTFAFLVIACVYFLLEYTRGRRTLPLAALFAALTPYAYAIATVFMSVFIAGFGLLYLPTLLRRWKESLIALIVGIAVIAPYVHFYQTHERAWQYAHNARWFHVDVPKEGSLAERARSVVEQSWAQWPQYKKSYLEFFSDEFLLQIGDRITRHSLRDHGELLPMWILPGRTVALPGFGEISTGGLGISAFKLLLILGAAICLLWPDRRPKLLLLWIITYPVAAAVMREVPSATRGFVGTGAFAALAAIGLAGILRFVRWALRIEVLGRAAQIAVAAAFLFGLFVPGVRHYLRLYWYEYPLYAALGPGGFQYGYGPAIEYMDSVRDQYDLLMITTSDTNQPPIFPQFYRRLDPTKGRTPQDLGYLVADPAQYGAYDMGLRILYAVQRRDLHYFTDYEIKKRILDPGGQEAFLIVDVRDRKRFLTEWMTLGPFSNEDQKGVLRDFIPTGELSMKTVENMYGDRVAWRPIAQPFVRTNFNDFYAHVGNPPPGNPEWVCAYAVTTLRSSRDDKAFLEISGSDTVRIWLNGELLTPGPMVLTDTPSRRPIEIRRGDNPLLVQTCEDIGGWFFESRIVDASGKDVDWLQARAALPRPTPAPVVAPAESTVPDADADRLQLVPGFAEVLAYQHTQGDYGDYRGGTMSWWAYSDDTNPTVIWETAAPAAKRPTAFAFTASMGGGTAPGELYVDGALVLKFDISQELADRTWKEGDWELRWVRRTPVAGNSGYFVLLAPRAAIEAGRPLELQVAIGRSPEKTWFMVKNYRDTIEHEHLTSEAVAAGAATDWQQVPSEATQQPPPS